MNNFVARLLSMLVLVSANASRAAYAEGREVAEVPAIRTYFYVGGHYVKEGNSTVARDQMYVERLSPIDGVTQETPVVLVHGNGQTGTNFLNKPDGGRGWASEFILDGYEVYIVDQSLRGRSPLDPKDTSATLSTFSAETIEQRFTAPENYGLWAQSNKHHQWPDSGLMGGTVFDAYYNSNVQWVNNDTYVQTSMQHAGAALLSKIGRPVYLIGHSQGGVMTTVIADASPHFIKRLVLLEPSGPPFHEVIFSSVSARAWGMADIPLTYNPVAKEPTDLVQQIHPAPSNDTVSCILQADNPTPRKLTSLAQFPILVVTSEASYHAQYDYCTAQFLRQAGCDVQHMELGKVGIHGNAHMFFLEKNSHDVYRAIQGWFLQI